MDSPVNNSFLQNVQESKDAETEKKPGQFPEFFTSADTEFTDLQNKVNPSKPTPPVNEFNPQRETKIRYESTLEIIHIDNEEECITYQNLLNELWNDTTTFAAFDVTRNWDKTGYLTMVITYVKAIPVEETEEEKATRAQRDKPISKATKIEKVKKENEMVDEVMPPLVDEYDPESIDPGANPLQIPEDMKM